MCRVCLPCSSGVHGSSVPVKLQRQFCCGAAAAAVSNLLCDDVTGSCEILEKMRTSLKPSWALHIPRASWSSVVSFHLLLLSPAYVWATTDCLLWVHVGVKTAEQEKIQCWSSFLCSDRRPRRWASSLLKTSKTHCPLSGDATCPPKGGGTTSTPLTMVSPYIATV